MLLLLVRIIKHSPSHKSPGPDGLSYSYYKTFLPSQTQYLLKLFASLSKGTVPYSQFLHAFISVILKPGKNNYCPVALLNSDHNIFTKILADKLTHMLPNLINKDQVGFVPTRYAGDNTRHVIDLLNKTQRSYP